MVQTFNVDFDAKDFHKKLGEHKSKSTQIARRCMGKVLSEIKKEIKNTKLKGQVLKKKSGNLLKKIKFKTAKDYTAKLNANSYYANFHEFGPTIIMPKKGKYLTFQINGEFKKVKSVTLPKRQFVLPVLQSYFNSNKAQAIMDVVLQDALTKIYEKGNK